MLLLFGMSNDLANIKIEFGGKVITLPVFPSLDSNNLQPEIQEQVNAFIEASLSAKKNLEDMKSTLELNAFKMYISELLKTLGLAPDKISHVMSEIQGYSKKAGELLTDRLEL